MDNNNKILEFFYKRASERVSRKIDEVGILHSKIYPNDPKQISWIINNRRADNNRFLICDAVLENYDDNKNAVGIVPKLGFSSKQEVLWGSKEEIADYLPELFKLLWNEVTADNSEYNINADSILCDYVPYAKYSTYWNILFSGENYFPAFLYGINEDDVINNIEPSQENAIQYLYKKCADTFSNIFIEFTISKNSFHKINKKFKEEFIDLLFIPMIKSYLPDEFSLGLRVKNLIIADLSKAPELIYKYFESGVIDEKQKQLNNASSNYILRLEEIQKMDG